MLSRKLAAQAHLVSSEKILARANPEASGVGVANIAQRCYILAGGLQSWSYFLAMVGNSLSDFGVHRGIAGVGSMQNTEPTGDHWTCWLCHLYPPGYGFVEYTN